VLLRNCALAQEWRAGSQHVAAASQLRFWDADVVLAAVLLARPQEAEFGGAKLEPHPKGEASEADVVLARFDQPALVGEHHRLSAVAQTELGEHTVDV